MLRRTFTALAGAAAIAGAGVMPALAQDGDPVKIGFLVPIRTMLGEQASVAAEVAVEMINADGGVLDGRPLELIPYDDGNSPVESVSGVQRLIDAEGVNIILGPYGSTQALAVLPVASAEEVLYLPVASKHPDTTASGYDKLFRFNSTVAMDGEILSKYMQDLDPEAIAFIGDNNETGRAYLSGLRSFFPDDPDNRVVFDQFYDSSSSDFSGIVTSAKASGADTLYLAGINVEQYGNVLRVAKELNWTPENIILAPGILNARAVEIADGGAEGAISTDIYVPSIETDMNARFVAAYEERVGYQPEKLEMLWFEGVIALAQAIETAGTAEDVDAIAEVMHTDTFETPRGDLNFDETGQALSSPFIVGVEDGVIVTKD